MKLSGCCHIKLSRDRQIILKTPPDNILCLMPACKKRIEKLIVHRVDFYSTISKYLIVLESFNSTKVVNAEALRVSEIKVRAGCVQIGMPNTMHV